MSPLRLDLAKGKMFGNQPSRYPPFGPGLFHGVHPENLPSYMQERLGEFFRLVTSEFSSEVKGGRNPNWYVEIRAEQISALQRYEWTEFQDGSITPTHFEPERYGYCDGSFEYTVSIKVLTDGTLDLSRATRLFSFLKHDEEAFMKNAEEIAYLGLYSIYRGIRTLPDQES